MNKLMQSGKIRYLLAGAWNTLFGYGVGVGFLYAFHGTFNAAEIGLICNILSITMSFVSYKVFVFKTKGGWGKEYFRCYVVYGGTALIGTGMLWFMVEKVFLSYWVAQGLVIFITIIVSYVGHAKFTFSR